MLKKTKEFRLAEWKKILAEALGNRTTYKYGNKTRDFAIVKSDSTVITFFISVDVDSYWEEEKDGH